MYLHLDRHEMDGLLHDEAESMLPKRLLWHLHHDSTSFGPYRVPRADILATWNLTARAPVASLGRYCRCRCRGLVSYLFGVVSELEDEAPSD
jgi:hypothetical protein